jgi:hypothetical protein
MRHSEKDNTKILWKRETAFIQCFCVLFTYIKCLCKFFSAKDDLPVAEREKVDKSIYINYDKNRTQIKKSNNFVESSNDNCVTYTCKLSESYLL